MRVTYNGGFAGASMFCILHVAICFRAFCFTLMAAGSVLFCSQPSHPLWFLGCNKVLGWELSPLIHQCDGAWCLPLLRVATDTCMLSLHHARLHLSHGTIGDEFKIYGMCTLNSPKLFTSVTLLKSKILLIKDNSLIY